MVWAPAVLFLFLALLAGSLAVLKAAFGARNGVEERVRSLRAGSVREDQTASTAQNAATDGLPSGGIQRLVARVSGSEGLALQLQRAGLRLRPGEFLLGRLAIAALAFLASALLLRFHAIALPVGIGCAVIGYLLPSVFLKVLRQRRAARMERQLVEFLPVVSSSLRSGFGMVQGIETAARQLGPPLAEELAALLRDVNLGASMQDALEDLGRRIDNPDLDIIITAVLVQRTTGGNLAEVLDKAAETLLDRERIRGDLQTMTAQQRLTGLVLSVYPVAVGLILLAIMPGMWSKLFTEPIGQAQLAIAIGLQALGFLAIRRVLNVDY